MIYLGTSGYHYEHWKEKFYPKEVKKSKWLQYYSQFFNSVELNVTFYRLPSERAFLTWKNEVPAEFVYAVKGSRFITHTKKLYEVEEPVEVFYERAKILGRKLGIVLWQFPQNFHYDQDKLEKFLILLTNYKTKNAFEFRHESWFNDECYRLLKKYNFALVIADSPTYPAHEVITSNYLYLRFHGGKILYGSEYSKKELESWAEKIRNWNVKDVNIYFNNDAFAFAINNAEYLKTRLECSP